MPGILPMKVIKVGASAQTRIAQACDRCRSKKIRCDGIRPCCSQCSNVGFECKTSDKLSRRAFPRGYTESLEERVRGLETEVRELKDLLDEKDEKIDMLSRLHSQSTQPIQLLPPRRPSTTSMESKDARDSVTEKDDLFKVQQSPYLLGGDGTDSYFAGTSSGRTFIEAFKHKVQEKGRSTDEIDTESLLTGSLKKPTDGTSTPVLDIEWKAPPRMVSDKLVNVFFQEWGPLFPVLHRPTFLVLYERYVADPDAVCDKAEIAQLHLVFGIAALSTGMRSSEDLENFEAQWRAAIDSILTDSSMQTLQALVLAQIFCAQRGDLTRLLTYKGLSTALSARLGLHQSQKRFALGTLTCETRKKVFWTLYTVDCFTAVTLGLPKHVKDEDVHCEYPVDADDEYITERGFQPSLPGESTKVSSSLALFRAARILSKVLEVVFPAKTTYDLSLKTLSDLLDELDGWSSSLAPHLRLPFAQDKPSSGNINSRSPLLSLTYHYIRALIQRPAICASLGRKSSSSMIALASSCKHIIQIVQLLDERGLSFSLCLNKDELLVLSGVGLMFQGLNLEPSSKILKDNQKMLSVAMRLLDDSEAPCANEFRSVANSFGPSPLLPQDGTLRSNGPSLVRHHSDPSLEAKPQSQGTESSHSSPKKHVKPVSSRYSGSPTLKKPTMAAPDLRRATVPNIGIHSHSNSDRNPHSLHPSASSLGSPSTSRSEPARSPINMLSRPNSTVARPSIAPQNNKPRSRHQQHLITNLDYLSFSNEPETQLSRTSNSAEPVKPEPGPTDWEKLLGSLDNGATNIYDATYGGQPVEVLFDVRSIGQHNHNHSTAISQLTAHTDVSNENVAWNPDYWALCPTDTNSSTRSAQTNSSGHPGSVLSFTSDEVISHHSTDEFATPDWASSAGANCPPVNEAYRAIVMPELSRAEELAYTNAAWAGGATAM